MTDFRRQRTDLIVFQALRNLLKTELFSDITVNQIAQKALIHRNTFYHHFDDKYNLLHRFIIYSLNEASNDVDVSMFSKHPFIVIRGLYDTSYQKIFDFQSRDAEFSKVFADCFFELFVQDMQDADNIWAMGKISSILTWNRFNGNPYDMFNDYLVLDQIFTTKQFPMLDDN
ncbi:TetR/AcrR family transcriptional regulator (plasmid) [Nicoliella spurrieriana]|uniref:TetR/AcrR family transcriptional regulator n=1 Tax=Nicoliella spurrieriana TaxID=2925830 RepID=A0A976RQM5_9LACO|nr:TetR/AcrR family transcriptional regulator [Nicoliella spurrieriana]UQS86112.1 TetR/AcrR family transcriptional regulator [Nicoliella spurrieriana]